MRRRLTRRSRISRKRERESERKKTIGAEIMKCDTVKVDNTTIVLGIDDDDVSVFVSTVRLSVRRCVLCTAMMKNKRATKVNTKYIKKVVEQMYNRKCECVCASERFISYIDMKFDDFFLFLLLLRRLLFLSSLIPRLLLFLWLAKFSDFLFHLCVCATKQVNKSNLV